MTTTARRARRATARVAGRPVVVSNDSHDTGKCEAAAKIIAQKAPEIPVIVCSDNPNAAEAAVKLFADKKPILFGANTANAEAMTNIAKNFKAILGVTASGGGGLDELSSLTEKIKSLGVQDIIIDSGARNAKDILKDDTFIRRAAIKKNFKPLGYPVITFAIREDSLLEALIVTIGVAKYSSIIVLSSIAVTTSA